MPEVAPTAHSAPSYARASLSQIDFVAISHRHPPPGPWSARSPVLGRFRRPEYLKEQQHPITGIRRGWGMNRFTAGDFLPAARIRSRLMGTRAKRL